MTKEKDPIGVDTAAEINRIIARLIDSGQDIDPEWVTRQVIANHKMPPTSGDEDDPEFYLWGTRRCVRNEVREITNRFRTSERGTKVQIVLPGFERDPRLQDIYPCKRNDREIFVLLTNMTKEELIAKADEHRARGEADLDHHDAIMNFVMWKFGDTDIDATVIDNAPSVM